MGFIIVFDRLKKIWKWLGEYHGDPMPIMMVQIRDEDDGKIYVQNVYDEQVKDGVAHIEFNGKPFSFRVGGKQGE